MARQAVRRLGLLSISMVLALGAAGCGGGSRAEVQRVEATCEQLETQLRTAPKVVGAEVNFLHTSVNPGDARALVHVSDGADRTALTELATRLIWTSDLEPLERISVTVGTSAPTSYDVRDQRAMLESRYGPRPTAEEEFDVGQASLALAGAVAAGLVLVVALIWLVIALVRRQSKRR